MDEEEYGALDRASGGEMPSARYSDLENVSVLVTGGGSGIGAELTAGFVRQGSKVAFIDIAENSSIALCDALEKETGKRPLYFNVDLTDTAALRDAAAKAASANGPVTVLVNNAAFDQRHAIADATPEYWDRNQAINLKQAFFAIQAVLPGMQAVGGGAIVNFTSTSYMMNTPGLPIYTAAKAGIVGLTKGLAMELGAMNIRVNAIAPGWVMTERQKTLWVTEEALAAHIAKQSIKDPMQPQDLVGPCLFLASNASKMMTAQTLIVDGGVL
jgi:NAD(P)-dependent dehydrogenase (short-subunit alcohol dehydrogenase family)